MPLFKKSKPENLSEEMKLKKEEKLLPDVMAMSYSEFVAQEHDSKVNPLKDELKELENRRYKLQSMYGEAVKSNDKNAQNKVSAAMHETLKQEDIKRLELQNTEQEYMIDMNAKLLAIQLDQSKERERLYNLYIQISQNSNTLLSLAREACGLAQYCGVHSSAGEILTIFHNQISYNLNQDLRYNIVKPDKTALLEALNNRLHELKTESDKAKSLSEKLERIK